MNILQINASIQSASGQSTRLANAFVAFVSSVRVAQPSTEIVVRDLARDPVPHLDGERFGAFITKAEARSPEQQAVVAYSDALIDEVRAADLIVIGLPLYNFGVPSQLKAWIDHIARAGETFRYTEKGPIGLLGGKRAVIFATRGGLHAGTPTDTQTDYIKTLLGFIGITDVEFVYAEGLAISEASKQESLDSAYTAAHRLAGEVAPAPKARVADAFVV
jgi:FMN-dependent NADH-azoreductase